MTADRTTGTAWVIGASSGIGQKLAEMLADRGWQVVVSARRADRLAGQPGQAVPVDVTDAESVSNAWSRVVEHVGVPDLLVYAAGTWKQADVAAWSSREAAQHIETNYLGFCRVLDEALPALRGRRSGRLVVLSSVAGFRGLPGGEYYGPTKAALINLTESLRASLASSGVRVTTVCPGFVDTEMTASNDFPMPFTVTAEHAAREILDGIEHDHDEVVFPLRMAALMKTARVLPVRLWSALSKRAASG